jgi:hypothetical protein
MRVTALVVFCLLAIVVLPVGGQLADWQWAKIPNSVKARFTIQDQNGVYASVMLVRMDQTITMSLSPGTTPEEATQHLNIGKMLVGWREYLTVWVEVSRTGDFWPTNFSFVQDREQYNVGSRDYSDLGGVFSGRLLGGTLTVGVIALSNSLSLYKPFAVYYGQYKVADMGPLGPQASIATRAAPQVKAPQAPSSPWWTSWWFQLFLWLMVIGSVARLLGY